MKAALVWTTIITLVVALQLERRAHAAALEEAAEVDEAIQLTEFATVWLGERTPPAIDSLIGTGGDAELRLVWIVSPDRCPECLEQAGAWKALAASGDLSTYLLVAGGEPAPSDVHDLGGATHIVRSDRDVLLEDFAAPFKSLRLAVDSANQVVAVDGRATGPQCGWSFEAMVAKLAGLSVDVPFYPSADRLAADFFGLTQGAADAAPNPTPALPIDGAER